MTAHVSVNPVSLTFTGQPEDPDPLFAEKIEQIQHLNK